MELYLLADTVLTDNQFVLSGIVNGVFANTQTGVNTKFTQELKEGDVIVFFRNYKNCKFCELLM